MEKEKNMARKSPTDRSNIVPQKSAARVAAGKKAAATKKAKLSSASAAAVDSLAIAADASAKASSAAAMASSAAASAQNANLNASLALNLVKKLSPPQSSTDDGESEDDFFTPTGDEDSSSSSGGEFSTTGYPGYRGAMRECPTHILIGFAVIGLVVGALVAMFAVYRNNYHDEKHYPDGSVAKEVNMMKVIMTILIAVLFAILFALIACYLYSNHLLSQFLVR